MDWHLISRPSRTEGWLDMLAPLAALKISSLKLSAIVSPSWGPPTLLIAAWYAVTAGSLLKFLGFCASHGVMLGMGAAAAYLAYRKQAATGLEKLDRDRAAFVRLMERERLDDQIVRDKLMAQSEVDRRAIIADGEARAFNMREKAEAGSLQEQLREAQEQIASNVQSIQQLKAEVGNEKARADELMSSFATAIIGALHKRDWAAVREEKERPSDAQAPA